MKKIICLILVLSLMLVMFAGCSNSVTEPKTNDAPSTVTTESGTTESATNEKKLVVMTVSNQQNAFMVNMGNDFKEIGEKNGYEVKLLDANADSTVQLSQIESAISQGAAAIFIEPCSFDGLTSGIQLAHDNGIPVITIHNAVSCTDLISTAIRCDIAYGGALKMQKCVDDLGGSGNIAIVYGILGQDTTNQIKSGYDQILAKYPDINIVFEGEGNWGAVDAAALAENWIASGKQIDAIVSMNDGMALGVLPVLKTTNNVGKIYLYGLDATQDGLQAVKAGEMSATIYVDAESEIVQAFKCVDMLLNGETLESEYVIPCKLIDINNVDEYLR